jgi:hypothetical protein
MATAKIPVYKLNNGIGMPALGLGVLLTSRYAFYAAALLAVVMVGAIITHVAVLGGSLAPALVLLVLSGIIAYLRNPQRSWA